MDRPQHRRILQGPVDPRDAVKSKALRLVAALALVASAANAQTTNLTATDRIVVASTVRSLVDRYFAHFEGAPKSQVDSAYRQYIDSAVKSQTRMQFDLATMRFVASLHNSHTRFFDDTMDGRPLKFRLLEVEGLWVVLGSQESRLPRGSVVERLNARPVEDLVRELSKYVSASNERAARTHVFTYAGLFPEENTLELKNGTVVVVRRSVPPDAPVTPLTASLGRWLREGTVAYIQIPSFGNPVFEQSAVADKPI